MSSPIYDSLAHSIRSTPWAKDAPYELLDSAFLQANVIVSTNVTEYFFAGTDQEEWLLGHHFPNLAPPFRNFWVETKAPTHIKSEVFGTQTWSVNDTYLYERPTRWAAWFMALSMAQPEAASYLGMPLQEIIGADSPDDYLAYSISLFIQREGQPIEPWWLVVLVVNRKTGQLKRNPRSLTADPYLFRSGPQGPLVDRLETMKWQLAGDGIPFGDRPLFSVEKNGVRYPQTLKRTFENEAVTLIKPLLLAICFLHCRNVERVDHRPSQKQNKARLAKSKPPFNRFHTLEIEPMRRIIVQAAAEYRGLHGRSGIEMAMHKVRGHFKTYTEEKPLMGKAVGTWFWGEMIKGTRSRGTVSKTYEVTVK